MRALLQRTTCATVAIEGKTVGEIAAGFVVLLGVCAGDSEKEADFLVQKLIELRVFSDENGKMNRSLLDTQGALLIVSQFTLYADCRKGRRPSFTGAGRPEDANRLYEYFCQRAAALGVSSVEKGVFGADMQVSLVNDGPVTILLDTAELLK